MPTHLPLHPTPTRNHAHALPLHTHTPTTAHPRLHLSMPTLTHNLTHVRTAAHLRPIFTGRFAPSFPTCPLFSTKLRPNRSAPTPPRKRTFALLSPVEPPLSSTELPSPSPTFPFSQRNCAPLSAHLRPCLCVPLLHTLAFEGRSEPIGVYQSLSESIRFPPISSD